MVLNNIFAVFSESLTVRFMGGFGDILAPRLIAEIGDVRRLYSVKALRAYADIAPPPYEFEQFVGSGWKVTKRGSPCLGK